MRQFLRSAMFSLEKAKMGPHHLESDMIVYTQIHPPFPCTLIVGDSNIKRWHLEWGPNHNLVKTGEF